MQAFRLQNMMEPENRFFTYCFGEPHESVSVNSALIDQKQIIAGSPFFVAAMDNPIPRYTWT